MDASTALQVDTGDLILGLRGLEKSAEQQSPVEETGAAVELCNNLILYPRVCYDGNIHKESRDEIKQLIERLADGIQDSDTKSLFVNKFLPIPLSQEQESSLVLQSATEAVSFLNVVEKLLSIPASSNNPVYQKEPFSNLDQFLALLRSPSIPEPASIDFFFSDRKIKGGRFFWALLHDQCFGPIAKYIAAKPHEANQRLLVVFWRYRYRFAANRGQEIYGKDLAFKGGCYYHPGRERQTFMQQFGEHLQKTSWSTEVEPFLASVLYADNSTYFDRSTGGVYSETPGYIPLLVNRALKRLASTNQLTRSALLRECLELSQDNMVGKMWDALETYDSLPQGEKEDCLRQMREYTQTSSDPNAGVKHALESILSSIPEKGVKEAVKSAALGMFSMNKNAASILGHSVDGLPGKLETLAAVDQIFGTIPLPPANLPK